MIEQPESREHQPVCLAGERLRENRVMLGVAGELLGERDQIRAARISGISNGHWSGDHRSAPPGSQPQRYAASGVRWSHMPGSRWRLATILFIAVLCGAASFVIVPPAGPRSIKTFDPRRLADLELRMWQAYYAEQPVRLFGLLVTLLHEQYRYSWATATREGAHLARAAARFGDLRSGYEAVLPDLEAAYEEARTWSHAGFDARAVARAELAWWVARRIPGENSPEQVGELMAEEYALLYETPRDLVARSALLRAEAAALRDAQAERPDWGTIGRLLQQSYIELRAALSTTAG
jgi:hypothetical protein